MMWLLFLMLSVASVTRSFAKVNPESLAKRIVDTEEECDSLQDLSKKKNNDIYRTLAVICEDSLNEDKYAYLELNKIDLAKYKDEDKIPVKTQLKEKWVKTPPQLATTEMKQMLSGIDNKENLLNSRTNTRGQAVVYKQIQCDLGNRKECFRELDCMKLKLINDLELDLKENKDYFEILYKGKQTNINSPAEADVTARCEDENVEEDEDDFGELEVLKILPLKLRQDGMKMVRKSVVGKALKSPVGKAALEAVTKGAMGEHISKQSLAGKLMTLVAPNLGGFVASSMMGSKGKSPFSLVTREHINTIMIFITNKLKKKEERVRLRKVQVKTAIEVVTKTFLHFLILSIRIKKGLSSDVVPKRGSYFVETIKIALIDSVAANVVNFAINILMPEDEGFDRPNAESGGSGGSDGLGGIAGFIDNIMGNPNTKRAPPPPPKPRKAYSSGELFDDDEDGYAPV